MEFAGYGDGDAFVLKIVGTVDHDIRCDVSHQAPVRGVGCDFIGGGRVIFRQVVECDDAAVFGEAASGALHEGLHIVGERVRGADNGGVAGQLRQRGLEMSRPPFVVILVDGGLQAVFIHGDEVSVGPVAEDSRACVFHA